MATRSHTGRWIVRIEPRGATSADVAVLLPLCDTMLKQAQLVAEHYDLPHGCASSICFYLGSGSPFPVTTAISSSAWPLAFDSCFPRTEQLSAKCPSSAPPPLPLPSSAVLTGLPICANLCFDFGLDLDDDRAETDVRNDMPSEKRASIAVKVQTYHKLQSEEQPTPTAATYNHRLGRSASYERRSSFQEMPYANLENSPSPRAAIFSGPFSPATRRMRTFAFNTGLRRRVSSNLASPCFRLLARPSDAGQPRSQAQLGRVEADGTAILTDIVQERGEIDSSSASRLEPGRVSATWTPFREELSDSDEETGDDIGSICSEISTASIETFRRSRSSLFSSTQGTTIWNEDDTFFEDARSHPPHRAEITSRTHTSPEADKGQRVARTFTAPTMRTTSSSTKLINSSPAQGTLARRRALTMSSTQPTCAATLPPAVLPASASQPPP
ncbi:hypothetical protein V8E36_005944 [Tilletia maclaganii]